MLKQFIRLTVSIVTYRSDPELFARTLQTLCEAVHFVKESDPAFFCELYIIENDQVEQRNSIQAKNLSDSLIRQVFDNLVIRVASSNLGYGRGHNLAITDSLSDVHLILNPDVCLDVDAISQGLVYLQAFPDAVMVVPQVEDASGNPLYLCKEFPALFDLFLRGFSPLWVQQYFETRLSLYEMRRLAKESGPVTNIKIASGCCMLVRTESLKKLQGFDTHFFLYFEDFDLSLRLLSLGKIAYLPGMKIVHYGGHAAKKGWRHILLFAESGVKFYRRHGWRFF